jgi:integrase
VARAIYKQVLNERLIRSAKSATRVTLMWDADTRGLVLAVRSNGRKTWKFIYSYRARTRWYLVGDADAMPLADARKRARELRVQVDQGTDPQAERKAKRGTGTFAELAQRYRNEYAKTHNKSWKQAAALVDRFLIPRWGKLQVSDITRTDVATVIAAVGKPVLANAVLASASGIFAWLIKQEIITANPCALVERNDVKSRERILSASELPRFWQAFDDAGDAGTSLKLILLTGQRPGEVTAMRRRHIDSGWWQMPGGPQGDDWLGTKNSEPHSVWLPKPAQPMLNAYLDGPRPLVDRAMRLICKQLGVERATPHDLRRTFLSTVTRLGHGRDAMDRISNHKTKLVRDVYDRHKYRVEDQKIMEAVSAYIMAQVTGEPVSEPTSNVIPLPVSIRDR